ncbi:PREDICTED: uncharacterized protein LOC106339969 [Brassica oleracea var. oleracea]|uniref:uncharacterized protein LOC106339969 n=1 Tax=Brassica oleracea var. oleracea TaxID=109376 RepID=UPI0006A6D820|nr:PREDICTED: uncharacterized protein LOC106339969 [Brassica oleracea var. oleracea]
MSLSNYTAVIALIVFAVVSAGAQSLAPAPSPTSDGTSIDQGIAYLLMVVALVLTNYQSLFFTSSQFSVVSEQVVAVAFTLSCSVVGHWVGFFSAVATLPSPPPQHFLRYAVLCLNSSFLVVIYCRRDFHVARDFHASFMRSETSTISLRAIMINFEIFAYLVTKLIVIYFVIPILFKCEN